MLLAEALVLAAGDSINVLDDELHAPGNCVVDLRTVILILAMLHGVRSVEPPSQ